MKIGIVGTDTSHVEIFAKELLSGTYPNVELAGYVPFFSTDFEISYSRTEDYEAFLQSHAVPLYETPETLAAEMDALMILTVDGRNHLDLYKRVAGYEKPVFIDKPVAMNLEEFMEMQKIEKATGATFFSSSSLRFADINEELKKKAIQSCVFRVPIPKQEKLPGYLWYGVHTLEWLQTLMGTEVKQISKDFDFPYTIRFLFQGNRIATIVPDEEWTDSFEVTCLYQDNQERTYNLRNLKRPYYHSLLDEIIEFFHTREKPVTSGETKQVLEWIQWIGE